MKDIFDPNYYGDKIRAVMNEAQRHGIMFGAVVENGQVRVHIENTAWTCNPAYMFVERAPQQYTCDIVLPDVTEEVI